VLTTAEAGDAAPTNASRTFTNGVVTVEIKVTKFETTPPTSAPIFVATAARPPTADAANRKRAVAMLANGAAAPFQIACPKFFTRENPAAKRSVVTIAIEEATAATWVESTESDQETQVHIGTNTASRSTEKQAAMEAPKALKLP